MKRPACSDIQQIPDFKTSRLPGFPGIYRKGIVKPTDEPTDKPSANEAISSLCSNEAPVPDWHWPTDEEIVKPTIVKQFKQMEPTIEPHPGEEIVKPTLEKEACCAKSCGLALPTIDKPTEESTIEPHPGEEIVKPTIVMGTWEELSDKPTEEPTVVKPTDEPTVVKPTEILMPTEEPSDKPTEEPTVDKPTESDEATDEASDEPSADRPRVKPTILTPKESFKPEILMPTAAFKKRGPSTTQARLDTIFDEAMPFLRAHAKEAPSASL